MAESKQMKEILKQKVQDKAFAEKLYANLCNLVWYDYINDSLISFSWRGAGGYVAGIRELGEDYMDFYCSGGEGIVDEEIETLFNQNGIVLFEDFYNTAFESSSEEEKIDFFKKTHPVVVAYNRDKNINNIIK